MRKKNLTKAVETAIAPNPKEVDIWIKPEDNGAVQLKYYDYSDEQWKNTSANNSNSSIAPFNVCYVKISAYDKDSAGAVVPVIKACIDFNTKQIYYITTGHGDDLSAYYSGISPFEEVRQMDIMTMEEEHFYKVTLLDAFDECNSSGLSFQFTAVYHSDSPAYEQSSLNYRLNTSHEEYTACEATADSFTTSYNYSTVGIEALNYVSVYLLNNNIPLRIY